MYTIYSFDCKFENNKLLLDISDICKMTSCRSLTSLVILYEYDLILEWIKFHKNNKLISTIYEDIINYKYKNSKSKTIMLYCQAYVYDGQIQIKTKDKTKYVKLLFYGSKSMEVAQELTIFPNKCFTNYIEEDVSSGVINFKITTSIEMLYIFVEPFNDEAKVELEGELYYDDKFTYMINDEINILNKMKFINMNHSDKVYIIPLLRYDREKCSRNFQFNFRLNKIGKTGSITIKIYYCYTK